MAWMPLTTASDQMSAEMLVQALREEGIEALVHPGDTAGYLGINAGPCRVMVPAERWREALALLERWEP